MVVFALDSPKELKKLRKLLKELCGDELEEFVGFTDGRELVKEAEGVHFDAAYINLDYNAKNVQNSGLFAAEMLYGNYKRRKLNIIGISDKKNNAHACILMDIYASTYIEKPYDRDKIIQTLKYLRFAVEVRDKSNPYIRHI